MTTLLTAVDELIARVMDGDSPRNIHLTAAEVPIAISSASSADRDEALRRLATPLPKLTSFPASEVAITCGAIVEHGGEPLIAGAAILEKLPDVLDGTIRFHSMCGDKAKADRLGDDEDDWPPPSELAQKYRDAIFDEDSAAGWAYASEESLTLGAIAHLGRSKALRQIAREMPLLLERARGYDGICRSGRSFLTKMLMTLDDEPLLVLHPEQRKGFRMRFSAIPDNFTLHAALMGYLSGVPDQGWLENPEGIDTDAIRRSLNRTINDGGVQLQGAFNLWNWTGVQPNGTLPAPGAASDHWIWNEGVPADIALFEGVRIVVLGPPPYCRGWRGGYIFNGLIPEVRVEEKLSANAVQLWMQKLGDAANPSG